MAFNLKGLGGRASGILSGVAAVATGVAAIFALLSQFAQATTPQKKRWR